ncbi:hypothetical protein [Nocardia sp. NPDC047038]|uniref:hypothetical protein n=1 Tax=Nocardia sp. NPDC047038 TaxID=3154338 RepID=UPI0033CB81F7
MSISDYTDFKDNAVAIDPPGCRCTDCQIGHSVALDDPCSLDLLAEQAVAGRRLINRTDGPLLLVRDTPAICPLPRHFPHRWRHAKDAMVTVSGETSMAHPTSDQDSTP